VGESTIENARHVVPDVIRMFELGRRHGGGGPSSLQALRQEERERSKGQSDMESWTHGDSGYNNYDSLI